MCFLLNSQFLYFFTFFKEKMQEGLYTAHKFFVKVYLFH